MVPYWLTVTMMAVFHPVTSLSAAEMLIAHSTVSIKLFRGIKLLSLNVVLFVCCHLSRPVIIKPLLNSLLFFTTLVASLFESVGDTKQTWHEWEFEAFCAIYFGGVVFSPPSLVLSISPLSILPSHWGLTSHLRETTAISRVVCVCLTVRVY